VNAFGQINQTLFYFMGLTDFVTIPQSSIFREVMSGQQSLITFYCKVALKNKDFLI